MLIFDVLGGSIIEEFGTPSRPRRAVPVGEPESATAVHFRIRLPSDENLRITDGDQRLRDLTGHLSVRPLTGEPRKDETGIGRLGYHSARAGDGVMFRDRPAWYWIEVEVPQAQLDSLISSMRAGALPASITVDEYGTTVLDEFTAQWDTEASPQLTVSRVSFATLFGEATEERAIDRAIENEKPPPPHTLDASVKKLLTYVKWLIGLVALIAVLQLFRH